MTGGEVPHEQASRLFSALPASQQAPSLHPDYVRADALREADSRSVFWVYSDGEARFYHAFHMARVPQAELSEKWFDIQSAYGYGGPLCSTEDAAFLAQAQACYLDWCKENQILAEFIRFHPLLDNERFYPGEIVPDRSTVWLDLSSPDVLASYQTRARTAVRKALKSGLRVEWLDSSQFAPLFAPLYDAAMQGWGAGQYYRFGSDYLQALCSRDWAHPAVCFADEEVVAAAIFLFGPQIAEYHLSASSARGKQLGATNLLIHEAALRARESGCRALHLGGGTDASPDNALLFFKAGFSDLRASFRFGKHIHAPAAYAALQARWQAQGKSTSRTLFYRF